MAKKHERIRAAIFSRPTKAGIRWDDIERLFQYLGAGVEEREGSRVLIKWKARSFVFHRPHPSKVTKKYVVERVREILRQQGEAADE